MRVLSSRSFNQETIAKVRELIDINMDSHNGLRMAGSRMRDTGLAQMFNELAGQRINQAVELEELVPNRPPTASAGRRADVKRTILDWSEVLRSGPRAILRDVERGENYIKAKYEALLAQLAESPVVPRTVTEVLNRHHSAVLQFRRRVRSLVAQTVNR